MSLPQSLGVKDTTPSPLSLSIVPIQPHTAASDPPNTESARKENLPAFSPAADPIFTFIWGNYLYNPEPFLHALNATYNEILQ